MELWRTEVIEGKRPKVLSGQTVAIALFLHLSAFVVFVAFAWVHGLFEKKEVIKPIGLTVIVNENLDGKEDEPPPLKNPPPPEPPKPQPKPKPIEKKPDPPKALEQIVTNIVKKVEKKDPPKKEPERKTPKPEPKKPEPPKKTAKELREERMKRIRDRMKTVNKPVKIEVKDARESGDGRTARQTMTPAQVKALLNLGHRPGTKNQLAPNEMSRCVSLIEMAIEDRWNVLQPKIGRTGVVQLSVRLNSAGGLVDVRLVRGCGDQTSDQAALSVARAVSSIRGLSREFIAKHSQEALVLNYKVSASR